MPSTFTLTLVAPAPGVSHFAPLPTCTTPGTVSGMMAEISPESPEFLETLRRLVGSLDDLAGSEALPTAGVSSLDDGGGGVGDDDFGGGAGDFELQVLADGAVGLDGEGAGFERAEALGVGHQAVGAGRKIGESSRRRWRWWGRYGARRCRCW